MSSAHATTSKVPAALRFSLVVAISLGLSSLLYSFAADFTGPELGAVSRTVTDNLRIGGLLAYKIAELGVAWYAGYDYQDLANLTLLNNVPYYFLLYTFYGIGALPVLSALTIDLIAVVVPFALLRSAHHAHASPDQATTNQIVAWDGSVRYLVALLGAAVYAIVVYSSFMTWLPTYMVVNFDGLRSVEKAHNAALFSLLAIFIPTGIAVTQFVFVPALTSPGNPGLTDPKIHPEKAPFDPSNASFAETVAWNLGISETGLSHRAKLLGKRSATLAASSFVNTFVRVYVTIEGTEIVGSFSWASVWAVAAGLVGVAYSLVADE